MLQELYSIWLRSEGYSYERKNANLQSTRAMTAQEGARARYFTYACAPIFYEGLVLEKKARGIDSWECGRAQNIKKGSRVIMHNARSQQQALQGLLMLRIIRT